MNTQWVCERDQQTITHRKTGRQAERCLLRRRSAKRNTISLSHLSQRALSPHSDAPYRISVMSAVSVFVIAEWMIEIQLIVDQWSSESSFYTFGTTFFTVSYLRIKLYGRHFHYEYLTFAMSIKCIVCNKPNLNKYLHGLLQVDPFFSPSNEKLKVYWWIIPSIFWLLYVSK